MSNNPFEYEGANKLSPDEILMYYIEDHNYSRFLQSKRNIFLVGDRGSGKSMTLLYNSLPVQCLQSRNKGKEIDLSLICIHIPCNTPLTYRREYELLAAFEASVISEHFLVISIIHDIAETFDKANISLSKEDEDKIIKELNYLYDLELYPADTFWETIDLFCHKENANAQKAINKKEHSVYKNSMSFISGVVPFLTCLKKTTMFKDTHFSLMLDDVHDLNEHQAQVVNSWISFRDNSLFSFKVASSKTGRLDTKTSSGGNIIEGHDYTLLDMEGEYQNKSSPFGKLAKDIIEKRLETLKIDKNAEGFFPTSPQFLKKLEKCRKTALQEALDKYGNGPEKEKARIDYIYKYTRAIYLRNRSDKANVPKTMYTGFDILVHLSTGIVRNLLEPCYWMYDKVKSQIGAKKITEISPQIQSATILDRSQKKWDCLENVHKAQECTSEQAKQIYQLFDNLAKLFKRRTQETKSEPRAIKFLITEVENSNYNKILKLLEIAKKEQLLYTYISSGKEFGKRSIYYVPNRMLWPCRGLDPCGQHSVVSLKASVLWDAAEGKEIPLDSTKEQEQELGLFDHE